MNEKNINYKELKEIVFARENIIKNDTLSKKEKIDKLIELIDGINNINFEFTNEDDMKKSYYEVSKELTLIIKNLATYDIKFNKYMDTLVLNYSNYKNKNTLHGYFSQFSQYFNLNDEKTDSKNNNAEVINNEKDDINNNSNQVRISFNEFLFLLLKDIKKTNIEESSSNMYERKEEISLKFLNFIYKKYPNLKKFKEVDVVNKEFEDNFIHEKIENENENENQFIYKTKNNSCYCFSFLILLIIAFLFIVYKYLYYFYYCFQEIDALI